MVEMGLVMGLIAVFCVATIWILADSAGERYQATATNNTQTDTQFHQTMVNLTGDSGFAN